MTVVLHTARISAIEVIGSSDKWIKMVNFKLGTQIFSLSHARVMLMRSLFACFDIVRVKIVGQKQLKEMITNQKSDPNPWFGLILMILFRLHAGESATPEEIKEFCKGQVRYEESLASFAFMLRDDTNLLHHAILRDVSNNCYQDIPFWIKQHILHYNYRKLTLQSL